MCAAESRWSQYDDEDDSDDDDDDDDDATDDDDDERWKMKDDLVNMLLLWYHVDF